MTNTTVASFNNTDVHSVAFDNLKFRVTIDTAPVCSFRMSGLDGSSWLDFLSMTICGLEGDMLQGDNRSLMHHVADVFDQLATKDAILPFENMTGGPDAERIADTFAELARSYRHLGKVGKFVHTTKKHYLTFDMADDTMEVICVTVEPVLRGAQLLSKEQRSAMGKQCQEQDKTPVNGFQPGLNPADPARNLMYTERDESDLITAAMLADKHMSDPVGNLTYTPREMAMNELQEDLQNMLSTAPVTAATLADKHKVEPECCGAGAALSNGESNMFDSEVATRRSALLSRGMDHEDDNILRVIPAPQESRDECERLDTPSYSDSSTSSCDD